MQVEAFPTTSKDHFFLMTLDQGTIYLNICETTQQKINIIKEHL